MLLDKVRKQIKNHNMISYGDTIVVGLSGGADSVCLFLMLCELQKELGFSLEAVHVEHGIRGDESRQDADFAEALCKLQMVSCQTFSVDVPAYAKENGLGFEEAARILRYEVFEQVAREKGAKIALAHHREDNAETILFQMARGSSLTGLCGIQPVRESQTGVVYIRPLLGLHRNEIEQFLRDRNQTYCTDRTNQELEYSRNYLRNVILPEFSILNHQAVAHINETAEQLGEIRDFLDEQVEREWRTLASIETSEDADREELLLDTSILKSLHRVLQKEIIYKAIGRMAGGKKDISAVHVELVLELMDNQSGKECMLPNGLFVIKEHTKLRFLKTDKRNGSKEDGRQTYLVSKEQLENLLLSEEKISLTIEISRQLAEISVFEKKDSAIEFPRKTYTKWLDYDKIKKGFCIRTRQSGDYLIYDAFGHRKKLKQYFVDEKIPVTKRDKIMILAQESQVLWVVGGRISEHVKVTEQTKVIVEITIKEEDKYE